MVLEDKAYKYGVNRVSLRVPNELKGEIEVGDPCEIYIDRGKKAIIYIFPESNIQNKEINLKDKEE